MHTVLVLGGYGFFGKRVSATLAKEPDIRLLLAGRDANKARAAATELGLPSTQALRLDAQSQQLTAELLSLGVDTVIHTAGPFQRQGYAVARAAIAAGANYIDLADGRDFVAGIAALDDDAKSRGVLVTSGASSLPALSSAVVDRYKPRFARIDAIRIAIASGARAPGVATMRGVFGYCGKPFVRLEESTWRTAHGWLGAYRHRFPQPVGPRWLGSCDVPDLTLFPQRYSGLHTMTFDAGFASAPGHLFVWLASHAVRLGLLPTLVPLVRPLNTIGHWIEPLLSDKGAMFVTMEGLDAQGRASCLTWYLVAEHNRGPYIPCGASIALARKLARGEALPKGAMPCMGLLNVDDYLAALKGFSVRQVVP